MIRTLVSFLSSKRRDGRLTYARQFGGSTVEFDPFTLEPIERFWVSFFAA